MVVFSLTLVRHGETKANKDGVIQGHQDVALSEVGLKQARLVAVRLQNDNFTHIFASDLSRAAQTAGAIAEANAACHCSVQHDRRLRERTFGEFEGKTFKELIAAAQKSNKKWPDFTPKGAESVEEVRFRAKAFFQELCQSMTRAGSPVDIMFIPASLKDGRSKREGLSNGTTAHIAETHTPQNLSAGVEKKTVSGATTKCASQAQPPEGVASKRPRTEDAQLRRLSLEEVGVEGGCVVGQVLGAGVGVSTMARSNSSSSSGCSSLHDSVECVEGDVDLSNTNDFEVKDSTPVPPNKANVCVHTQLGPGTNSSSVQSPGRWQVDGPLSWFRDIEWSPVFGSSSASQSPHACPNVSLSPMIEHRLTSISSVSSGRNSSFDDADIVPAVVGEVLVVSHGGLIKELVAHFIEDFNCKIPGGKGHALRVCPNTGVSRFTVTVDDLDCRASVTCQVIHDKDHLHTLQASLPEPTPAV
ncbi:uncharacterized protein [Littorina saxatilis]|uniref:Fructose-2,6-bisphosphatase TIGAR n=1 Tax=Littorina saxatilis TaxID=31220 RepID=A0AAN9BIY5_9CAEN